MATPDDGLRVRLREARRGMGLRQQEVADKLGVSRRAVSEWETGNRRPHSMLPELAALYGVSTSWLLTGAEEASVELRELRKQVDELYDVVIKLAEKTGDIFTVLLESLESGESSPATASEPRSKGTRRRGGEPVANGRETRSRQAAAEQPEPG